MVTGCWVPSGHEHIDDVLGPGGGRRSRWLDYVGHEVAQHRGLGLEQAGEEPQRSKGNTKEAPCLGFTWRQTRHFLWTGGTVASLGLGRGWRDRKTCHETATSAAMATRPSTLAPVADALVDGVEPELLVNPRRSSGSAFWSTPVMLPAQ
jgi:hypothetical protein